MRSSSVDTFQDRASTALTHLISYLVEKFCATDNKDVVSSWRERIFFIIFFSTTTIGTFSYISSMALVISMGKHLAAVLFTLYYFIVILITFSRWIPYTLKTFIGLGSFYSLGMVALITIGPAGCGHIWLFAFAVAACLIRGFGTGLAAIAINYLSLFLIGHVFKNGWIVWEYTPDYNYAHWTATTLDFCFLTVVIVISLSMILDNFTRLLLNEIATSKKLFKLNCQYETENNERLKTESALKSSLNVLNSTKTQLVQSEKMAALGKLVAGVTHELNTPVGVGVTASSFLEQKTTEIIHLQASGKLTDVEVEKYIRTAQDACALIHRNMNHVAGFIKTFDQLAIDHTTETPRVFFLKEYIEEIIASLRIQAKIKQYDININCSEGIKLNSYPGAFSQIVSHLVQNSVNHGFSKKDHGKISFDIHTEGQNLLFRYKDDGEGMTPIVVKRIFDPFYTTKREKGHQGLGMNIIYNLVTQLMKGDIDCKSTGAQGVKITISVPLDVTYPPPSRHRRH